MHKKNNQYSYVLEANVEKSIYINLLERKLIPTDFYVEFYKLKRKNFFIKRKLTRTVTIFFIHFSEKKKISVKNESFYREIQIVIINLSLKPILIKPYQKIAIMEIYQENEIKWEKVSILNKSIRGENSFGSTGI
ncbi:dCTP deaminase/dUTPase family protein [Blattabacterium cuenoti]|uniref:deoxyuridine 5'-triphosphate nucleotidohydrolase n=1 Tax=Blattabacterium cuenoti TaxID=1653831 RepID=UPI00163C923E|nr:deoxyuridine 5'-triphosphate nucleotidohydrolase [Blattabacterium cuenoti]